MYFDGTCNWFDCYSFDKIIRYNIKIRSQQMSSDEDNGEAIYSDSDSDVPNR